MVSLSWVFRFWQQHWNSLSLPYLTVVYIYVTLHNLMITRRWNDEDKWAKRVSYCPFPCENISFKSNLRQFLHYFFQPDWSVFFGNLLGLHALMVWFEKSQKVPETAEQNLSKEVIMRYEVIPAILCYFYPINIT